MVKQTVSLKVLPEDATNKELTCTLSDKSLATIKPVTGGVELETKKSGTGELTVESHHGEVTKTVPVNVGETNDILIDGTNGTGSRYVKDLSAYENLIRDKNNFESNVWLYDQSGKAVVKKNGFANGIDSLVQDFPSDSTANYRDIIVQILNYKSKKVERLLQGEWYTVTFYARNIDGGSLNTYVYPKAVDSATKIFVDGVERAVATAADCAIHWSLTSSFKKYSFSFKTISGISDDDFKAQLLFRLESKGSKAEIANIDVCKGKNIVKEPTVAPEDVGVIHGQPNLLSGTSNEWETITFSGWNAGRMELLIDGTAIKAGDIISYRCEIDATETVATEATSTPLLAYTVVKSDGTTSSSNSGSVLIGTKGVVVGSMAIPEKATSIIFRKAAKNNDTETITVKIRGFKAILGAKTAMDEWTPTQAEFEGLPNLLDGTMGTWQDFSFTGWQWSYVRLLLGEDFNIGDTFTLTSEIDNKASMPLYVRFAFATADNVVTYANSNQISAGSTGVATVTTTVPSNCAILYVHLVVKGDGTSTATGRVRKIKLVKGDKSQLGIWTPKSRTEYDKNLGIVPFTEADYNTLQTADEIVRAETKVVGRGAEIQFDFDVIGALENKYPYLFEGLTTVAEKIAKYKTIVTRVNFTHNSKGYGVSNRLGTKAWFARSYIRLNDNYWWYLPSYNTTADFLKMSEDFSVTNVNRLSSTGIYKLKIASANNYETAQTGAISDGVTPAWVEVKDIRLEVTIQLPEDPNAQPITITIPPS